MHSPHTPSNLGSSPELLSDAERMSAKFRHALKNETGANFYFPGGGLTIILAESAHPGTLELTLFDHRRTDYNNILVGYIQQDASAVDFTDYRKQTVARVPIGELDVITAALSELDPADQTYDWLKIRENALSSPVTNPRAIEAVRSFMTTALQQTPDFSP